LSLKLFNTLGRRKESFKHDKDKNVLIYCCGPTVYDYAHIGNFRTFLFEDILIRYLQYKGYKVKFVMNITDIDDKTIKASSINNVPLKEYTKKYENAFFEDILKLRIRKAECYPRATEHINNIVNHIKKLKELEFAYESNGSIYFSISKFKKYGSLSGEKNKNIDSEKRIDIDEYSKNEIQDFALWKAWVQDDKDVFWNNELGKGRPGWHIECSVMSTKLLNNSIDIHAGGVDLIFPHHENEIAQSEALTNKKFVRYWLHAEHLIVEGKKMSKSQGNYYTLRDLLKAGYEPLTIRLLLISSHYRNQLNFTINGLKQSSENIKRLQEIFTKVKLSKTKNGYDKELFKQTKNAKEAFEHAMDDDLNMPIALASIFNYVRIINKYIDKTELTEINKQEILDFFIKINQILDVINTEEIIPDERIRKLLRMRNEARERKDWKKADEIRKQLLQEGFIIEDTANGSIIKQK